MIFNMRNIYIEETSFFQREKENQARTSLSSYKTKRGEPWSKGISYGGTKHQFTQSQRLTDKQQTLDTDHFYLYSIVKKAYQNTQTFPVLKKQQHYPRPIDEPTQREKQTHEP